MLAISRSLNAALLCQEYLEYVCFLDILDFHDVQEHQGQGSTASLDSCLDAPTGLSIVNNTSFSILSCDPCA